MTEKKPGKRVSLEKLMTFDWVKHGLKQKLSQSGLILPNYEKFLEKEQEKQMQYGNKTEEYKFDNVQEQTLRAPPVLKPIANQRLSLPQNFLPLRRNPLQQKTEQQLKQGQPNNQRNQRTSTWLLQPNVNYTSDDQQSNISGISNTSFNLDLSKNFDIRTCRSIFNENSVNQSFVTSNSKILPQELTQQNNSQILQSIHNDTNLESIDSQFLNDECPVSLFMLIESSQPIKRLQDLKQKIFISQS